MITFQVIDKSGYSPVMFNLRLNARTLTINDDYKIEKWLGGLKIIESGMVHKFDVDGCFIGTHSEKGEL